MKNIKIIVLTFALILIQFYSVAPLTVKAAPDFEIDPTPSPIIDPTPSPTIDPTPLPTIDPISTTTPIIDDINESEYYKIFNNELVKLNVTSIAILIVLSMLLIKYIISSIFNR